jgi:tRNA(fMet)-specific endonuclease VapC
VRFILDTDLLTIVKQQSQPFFAVLQAKLQPYPAEDVGITIISFQEEVQGWMAQLNKARTSEQILKAYAKLEALLQHYRVAKVLPFDRAAQDLFVDLRRQRIRIATLDLRIACIARTANATLLSRNLRDFRKVPGLQVADWSR